MEDPTYTLFGLLLDVFTLSLSFWLGSTTEFGGKIPWISSLFHHPALVGEEAVPCRVNLLHDYDDGDGNACLIDVTLENYVTVRRNEDIRQQQQVLAAVATDPSFVGRGCGVRSFEHIVLDNNSIDK